METAASQKRTKLFHHLKKWLEKAVMDFAMIEKGDRVLIGFSGGADSHVLLDLLRAPMVFVPSFEIIACHIDHGFDDTFPNYDQLENHLRASGTPFIMEKSNFGALAHSAYNRKKSPCFLCSHLRRKRLFEIAAANNCNKIALGHHRDDIIETLLLNLFYAREISTMVPMQSLFGGTLHIIRPFFYIREELIKRLATESGFNIAANPCPSAATSRRAYIKNLLQELAVENKGIHDNLFRALSHVKTDYLVGAKSSKRASKVNNG